MKVFKAVAAGAICAMALAACGGSSSSGPSSSGSNPAAANGPKPSGTPIKILAEGTFSGPADSYPQMLVGMTSAVDAVNASGGINGHPLSMTTCNVEDNPNIAQACAGKAVSNHDVAVVTGDLTQTDSAIPTLQQAGIPFIGSLANTVDDATSPISFPGAVGAYNGNAAVGVAAKAAGCKKAITVSAILPGLTSFILDKLLVGLKGEGIPVAKSLTVSLTNTSFAPAVAAAVAEHADCIASVLAVAPTTAMMAQVKETGGGTKLLAPGVNVAPLNTLAGVGDGDYIFSFSWFAGASKAPAGISTIVNSIKKYGGSSTSIATTSLTGYASILLLEDALKPVHVPYTAATTLSAMNHLQNASTDGVYPPYTTTKPTGVKGESRMFNATAIAFEITGQAATPVSSFAQIPGV
jgi:branched-chain amino acid transport system substrate-binding protein